MSILNDINLHELELKNRYCKRFFRKRKNKYLNVLRKKIPNIDLKVKYLAVEVAGRECLLTVCWFVMPLSHRKTLDEANNKYCSIVKIAIPMCKQADMQPLISRFSYQMRGRVHGHI